MPKKDIIYISLLPSFEDSSNGETALDPVPLKDSVTLAHYEDPQLTPTSNSLSLAPDDHAMSAEWGKILKNSTQHYLSKA